MKVKSSNPRWLALQALLLVLRKGRALDEALSATLISHAPFDARDLALCRELANGVCRWYFSLTAVLSPCLRKPFKPKDQDLEIILLIGLYQILLMRVDDHAAVNETVRLAQSQNKPWARGLINAVLRQSIRDQTRLDALPVTASYPAWMQALIEGDWGQQSAAILDSGNQRAPMTLRLDLAQQSIASYQQILQQQGINATDHEWVESAIVLDKPCPVTELPGFDTGLVSVQDAATQLAAGLLDTKPGMRVLDACAAPGGKTLQLLQTTAPLTLIAVDQDKARLELIRENLNRIRREAQLICGDAASPADWHDGILFDRILADVPCSASGVIRRHPDIKVLRRASDIAPLVTLQKKIVTALWPLLKPGGLMLYSTCSIFKDENERQVAWFVEKLFNCEAMPLNSVQWGEERPFGRQILPGQSNMDGFYYCILRKIAGSVDPVL